MKLITSLHAVLSLFVPINIAFFYYWPSINDVPRWIILSIVITFIQITMVKAAVNINRAWHWDGFVKTKKCRLKWWRRTVYLTFALFVGLIIYEGTSEHIDKTIILNVIKTVFIGINVWYLGFSLMGDELAVSKEVRDIEDHFVEKLVDSAASPKEQNNLKE